MPVGPARIFSQHCNSPDLAYLYEKQSRGNTVDVESELLSNRTMIQRKLRLIPCDSLVYFGGVSHR